MLTSLKRIILAAGCLTLLYSCHETTGGQSSNDSIPVPGVPPPSNEVMTAKLHQQLAGKYDNVWDYSEGMIAVLKNGKYGFCDSTGKEVIPFQYTEASEFKNGVAVIKKEGKVGFIDKTGKELFPLRDYDYAGSFDDGLSSFRIIKAGKELYGFVDQTGNEVVPPVYEDAQISWFDKGNTAIVKKAGKWGTITKQNAVVIPFEYDAINDFNNGITTAKKAGKWGIIDSTNKVLVPFTMVYKTVYELESGYAHVENNKDQEGFIDVNGKEAFGGLRFRETFGFSNAGYAIVSEGNDNRYLIDKQGKTFFKGSANEDIIPIEANMFVVTRNKMQGIVDINDKVLLPIEYPSILPMGKNLLLIFKDGKRYYADYKGNKVADYIEQ
ncbi:MAG: WG repeat-containing protein [Chitinophagaceae bacterium]